MSLPNPNIELKPGQVLTTKEFAELVRKLQQNFDYIDRKLKS